MEKKRFIIITKINNTLKYREIAKNLFNLKVIIKFILLYKFYQNGIIKRFNRTIITLIKAILK